MYTYYSILAPYVVFKILSFLLKSTCKIVKILNTPHIEQLEDVWEGYLLLLLYVLYRKLRK